MIENKLKINDSKTEFLVMTQPRLQAKLPVLKLQIGGCLIESSANAKNLGVVFDSCLLMDKQITNICCGTYFYLRKIGSIRRQLTNEATEQLVHALVSSRLDYCNSLLSGIPDYKCDKLQRVQNTAARIVTRTKKCDHISPVLYNLHWLPVKFRIQFKILLLVYRTFHSLAPDYLSELVNAYQPGRALRSADKLLLAVPLIRLKSYGERSFAFSAVKAWNTLPHSIQTSKTIEVFKTKLKTFLFKKAYDC